MQYGPVLNKKQSIHSFTMRSYLLIIVLWCNYSSDKDTFMMIWSDQNKMLLEYIYAGSDSHGEEQAIE